ncbi:hypothetical protein BJ508DRAFT_413788 [Ascobolus immersus RN42]|uniref:Uncharacterized protein n=1 Tax=Ascobolus immersus RN42 TaxID=1160509 RepID=A0A3N4I9U1_ASCIM|nr:hypothetical protein BJ508DRAFT_413788 [Ascobolus immersus RN42]
MAFSMRTDPRIRQSLNQFSSNLENATENARVGCFAFSQRYLEPLYHSIADCCQNTTSACIPDRRRRRRREFPFDFYNEDLYDEDTNDFMGWGNDELDRLLAGSGANQRSYGGAPTYGPPTGMFYHNAGSSGRSNSILRPPPRRKSAVVPHDGGPDPTIIPNTSALGFLSRIPFMRSTLRYQPSAADLQEHPGRHDEHRGLLGGRRRRSNTSSSGETSDSMRSRADLFPSEDEEDAVPLGDEFDIGLRSSGTSETSLAAKKGKKKKKSRQEDMGSPRPGRSRRRGSDRTLGSSVRSNNSGIASPASGHEILMASDARSIERQLSELIGDESLDDAQAFLPYGSPENDAHFSETTKPFPQFKEHADSLSVSERRSLHAPTSPALSARSVNSMKRLLAVADADILPDETLQLNGEALPTKELPVGESSRIAIVQEEIQDVNITKEEPAVEEDEKAKARSTPATADDIHSDVESDATVKVTPDHTDVEPISISPSKPITKEAELRSATQPPAHTHTPTKIHPRFSQIPVEKYAHTTPIFIPIPSHLSPSRPSLAKSYTSPPPLQDIKELNLASPAPFSKSLSSWTWSKLGEWFPPIPKDTDWTLSSGHTRKGSGGYMGKGARNPEEDGVDWLAGGLGGGSVGEEEVAERWRRSMEVLRDDASTRSIDS